MVFILRRWSGVLGSDKVALWADPIEVWRLVLFIQLLLTTSPNHGLVHSNSSSNKHVIDKYICSDQITERHHKSSQAVHNSHPLYRKVEGSIHLGKTRSVFSRQCRNSRHSGKIRRGLSYYSMKEPRYLVTHNSSRQV